MLYQYAVNRLAITSGYKIWTRSRGESDTGRHEWTGHILVLTLLHVAMSINVPFLTMKKYRGMSSNFLFLLKNGICYVLL